MIYSNEIAQKTAEYLLQIKAIKLSNSNPFHWASGWLSPIYCDNRKTLSYPEIRSYIRQKFTIIISEEYAHVDVIAGVATGGIAIGALVAEELEKPFIYIRSSKKGHGLQNQIEGVIEKGQTVVVVEDLISTGNSSLNAVAELKKVEAEVLGMVSIFDYGFALAKSNFEKNRCHLYSLSDYNALLETALANGTIQKEDLNSLKEWRNAPEAWGK